jgi:hypothetical protein
MDCSNKYIDCPENVVFLELRVSLQPARLSRSTDEESETSNENILLELSRHDSTQISFWWHANMHEIKARNVWELAQGRSTINSIITTALPRQFAQPAEKGAALRSAQSQKGAGLRGQEQMLSGGERRREVTLTRGK